MATGILVLGPAGTGKSTGIESLDPKKTFIINTDKKPLPFRGWRKNYKSAMSADSKAIDVKQGNYLEISDSKLIKSVLELVSEKRPEIEVAVVDTLGHAMTAEFMKNANVVGFQKFTDLALNVYNICTSIPNLRKDLFIFVLSHVEQGYDTNDNKIIKIRTIGKMLDEKVDIQSMFTVVLQTEVKEKSDKTYEYTFITNNGNPAKSPKGMFLTKNIPNDYALVIKTIKEYDEG